MYNDLTGTKKINGLPADQNALSDLISNQNYFKNIHDNDEDLSALDRNIIPTTDNTFDIGSSGQSIREIFTNLVSISEKLELAHGSLAGLPFSFTGETLGFFRSAPGEMTFVSGATDIFSLSGSRAKIKAANSNQLLLQSTESGLEDTWGIGGNLNGMTIFNASSGINNIIRFLSSYIQPLVPLRLGNGSSANPVLSFMSDDGVGIYKDGISPRMTWVVNEDDRFSIDEQVVEVHSGQIVIPDGQTNTPGLTFSTGMDTGISRLPGGGIEFSVSGTSPSSITSEGFRPMTVASDIISGPQTDIEVDVSNTSKLIIDCTSGDVSIKGLTNAKEGSLCYLIMSEPTGILTVRHDDLSAVSSVLLKGSTDFVINNDYGGLVLSYDQGVWREVSRS